MTTTNLQELQKVFRAFREQCIWIQICHSMYSKLYESDENKKVLEDAASIFFTDLNTILLEYCYLQICKITDPAAGHKKNSNLTVEYLNEELRKANLITNEIINYSTGLSDYRKLIVDPRNKYISHLDKDSVLGGQVLGAHEERDVSEFFKNLYGYVDAVGNVIELGPLDFRTNAGAGDVLDLIKILKRCMASN